MYYVVVVGFHIILFDRYSSVSAIKKVSIDRCRRFPNVAEADMVTCDQRNPKGRGRGSRHPKYPHSASRKSSHNSITAAVSPAPCRNVRSTKVVKEGQKHVKSAVEPKPPFAESSWHVVA